MSNNNMTINFNQGNLADMWNNNTSIKEGSLCLAFANNNSAMLYYKSTNNFIPIMPQGANPGQVLCSIDENSAPAYTSAMVLGNGGANSKSGSITLFNSSGQSTSITNEAIGQKSAPFGTLFSDNICITLNKSYSTDSPENVVSSPKEGQVYFKIIE